MSTNPKKLNRRYVGQLGEQFAADYLVRSLGWKLLARNWRCRYGELDVVAADQDTVVYVEVRTVTGDRYGDPEASVGPAKQRQLLRTVRHYVKRCSREEKLMRFDVIGLVLNEGVFCRLTHLRDAWIIG